MSKVWNVVGSFIGDYEMIPEGSTLESVNYIQSESKLNYYSGEYYNPALMKFQATFRLPDKTTLKTINIPSNQMITNPKGDLGDIMGIDTPFQYVDSGASGSDSQRSTANITFWYQYKENQSAQVQEKSVTVTFFIWKEKFTFDRIEIIKNPNKMEYYNGDYFNPEGMEIAVYSKEGLVRYPKQCENKNTQVDCFYFNLPIVLRPTESGYTTVPVIYKAIPDFESSTTTIEFSIQVRVYEDERKAQLDVSLAGAKTLYYSGSTFSKSGIIVKKKYPQDVTYPDTNIADQCTIQILEFPSGVVEYNEINQGNLTLIVSYTDKENSNKVTTFENRDQIKVYEVDKVQFPNNQESYPIYEVGTTLPKTDFPMTVNYKPSNIVSNPSFDQRYLNVTNFNWVAINNVINSAGTLLSEYANGVQIKGQWTHPEDPKQTKTVFEAATNIIIVKKKFPVTPPSTSYGQDNPYPVDENTQIKPLTLINVGTSSFKTGIDGYSATVNGATVYNNISYGVPISETSYSFSCTVQLKTDDPNYTYVWSDTQQSGPRTVVVYGQIQAKHTASVSFSPDYGNFIVSYDYSNGNKTTSSVNVSVIDNDTSESISLPGTYLEVSSYSDSYISVNPTNSIKHGGRITITAKEANTYVDSVTATIRLSGCTIEDNKAWKKTTITVPASSFSGTVNYLNKWNWNQEVSPEWIEGLKVNNPSQYISSRDSGNYFKSIGNEQFFLLDVSGSGSDTVLTWGCHELYTTSGTRKFITSSSYDLSDWSNGNCYIQQRAEEFAGRYERHFGNFQSERRQLRWDNSTAYCYMKAWPPSAEEIGRSNQVVGRIKSNTINNSRFDIASYDNTPFNSSYWLCNGVLASADSSITRPNGPNVGKTVALYDWGKDIVGTKEGYATGYNYVFCFRV